MRRISLFKSQQLGSARHGKDCELQTGIGETYHFWDSTGGVVIPITLNWSDSRYQFGLFRLSRRQILYGTHYPRGRLMADPHWGMSVSRRWRKFTRGPVRGFFGFGILAKTESDQLSVTRLDFTSQLGMSGPVLWSQIQFGARFCVGRRSRVRTFFYGRYLRQTPALCAPGYS